MIEFFWNAKVTFAINATDFQSLKAKIKINITKQQPQILKENKTLENVIKKELI